MASNILSKICFTSPIVRKFCRNAPFSVELLENRSVVRLKGEELFGFIQGLITNDIFSLTDQKNSLYTFFLNTKGRILYDVLMYRISNLELLLECDSVVKDSLIKHLKAYCIRKKIDILPEDSNVWVMYSGGHVNDFSNLNAAKENTLYSTHLIKNEANMDRRFGANVLMFEDPRLSALGVRMISAPSEDITELLPCNPKNGLFKDFSTYRCKLGVAEGDNELPVGSSFPHEVNGDYLQGISFNKGCYIGQELTARVQHTGVVRKRLMPIILSQVPDCDCNEGSTVMTKEDKKVGKVRIVYKTCGIALLRVSEALENKDELRLSGVPVRTYEPFWWPRKESTEE